MYALSNDIHDCRNYANCSSEFQTTVSCPIDSLTGKQTYWNNEVKACGVIPPRDRFNNQLCDPVFGHWSEWQATENCTLRNNACVRNEVRSCNNPAPFNDPDGCSLVNGGSNRVFTCPSSSCQITSKVLT